MTLQQLEYIVALDEERHFVRAADRCFVTQPTLSMQVQKLEELLGVMIFDRKKQPLQPTIIGVEIILRARVILREARQVKEMVLAASTEMTGHFRIGVIPTLAPYLVPRFLKPFLNRHPDISLSIEDLQTTQIFELLDSGQLDVALMAGPTEMSQLREYPVFQEPFLLYTEKSHPLVQEKTLYTAALDPQEMWILKEGHCFRNQMLNVCEGRSQNERQRYTYESGSIETLKRMVRQSGGYTLIPDLALEEADKVEGITVRHFEHPQPFREICLVTHHSYARHKFVQELHKEILSCTPERLQKMKGGKRISIQ